MFKKLDFEFDHGLIKKLFYLTKYIKKQPCELYGDPSSEGYKGETEDDTKVIKYYGDNIFCKFVHYKFNYPAIFNHLPSSLLNKEVPIVSWQVISGGKELPAHVDLVRKCALNFYINSNQETTIFYQRKRKGVFLKEKDDKYTSNELFLPEWLEPINQFTADNLDVYALDTTVPHSVNMMNENDERIAVSFSFYNIKFEDVIECFKN